MYYKCVHIPTIQFVTAFWTVVSLVSFCCSSCSFNWSSRAEYRCALLSVRIRILQEHLTRPTLFFKFHEALCVQPSRGVDSPGNVCFHHDFTTPRDVFDAFHKRCERDAHEWSENLVCYSCKRSKFCPQDGIWVWLEDFHCHWLLDLCHSQTFRSNFCALSGKRKLGSWLFQ